MSTLPSTFWLIRRVGAEDDGWEFADAEQAEAMRGNPHFEVQTCRPWVTSAEAELDDLRRWVQEEADRLKRHATRLRAEDFDPDVVPASLVFQAEHLEHLSLGGGAV